MNAQDGEMPARAQRSPSAATSSRICRCDRAPSDLTSSTSAGSTATPAASPTTRASRPPPTAPRRSPTSTATRACCSIAATRSSSWPRSPTSSRSATCCSTASCRPRPSFENFRNTITRHTMVHEQMTRFFTGFRRDAHPMAIMCGSVGALSALLPRLHRHQRSAAAHDRQPPHDRQDADARGDGLQVLGRPALHLSAQRPRLHLQLPADVLRGAVRALRGEPDRRRARSTAS